MKKFYERTDDVLEKVEKMQISAGVKRYAKRGSTKKRIFAIAASAAAVLVLNLVLFVPFKGSAQNISAYKRSEYYGIVKTVNELTYTPPKYKNNFEKLLAAIKSWGVKYGSAPGDMVASPSIPQEYVENTLNQVSGVIEGDLLKRSTDYAYYLSLGLDSVLYLNIYSINGAQSERLVKYRIDNGSGSLLAERYYENAGIYLSADCKTVTVISNAYSYNDGLYTRVLSVDVSDISNVHESSRAYISGDYISSRTVDGALYVFTNMNATRPDFKDESTFLPQTGSDLNDMESLPADKINYDENADIARYTVVSKFDEGELCDSVAFLSYSTEAYVSSNNIYLTHDYVKGGANKTAVAHGDILDPVNKTDVARVSYGDGLKYENIYTVDGIVNDQFSIDEKDGALRIVTTVNSPTNASLYIIDIEKGEFIAKHERFAPDGERVYSVRFEGDIAYVCTAKRNVITFTDPVYKIDLSDPQNITSKDTGDIEGYSSTLIKFKDGLLLGIGSTTVQTMENGWTVPAEGLKIELYAETENGLESYAKYERAGDYSTQFKAYYIDAERGLIGIAVADGTTDEYVQYYLLLFDVYNFVELKVTDLDDYYLNAPRAFYENGNVYLYHNDRNYVLDIE